MMPLGKYLSPFGLFEKEFSHFPSPKHPSRFQTRYDVQQEFLVNNRVCIRRPNFWCNGSSPYWTNRGVYYKGRRMRSSLTWEEGPALGRAAPWSEHWVVEMCRRAGRPIPLVRKQSHRVVSGRPRRQSAEAAGMPRRGLSEDGTPRSFDCRDAKDHRIRQEFRWHGN